MSIRRLPRELGIIVCCNGTGERGCSEQYRTGNVMAGHTRAWLKGQGWGRGLRKNHKRADLCPTCLPVERALLEQDKAAAAERKKRRDEVKKAMLSMEPRPKKPRKSRTATSSPTTSSPSADSAPAPAT